MRASLILIGDELLNGKVQDTNGSWLAQQLFFRGIFCEKISLVNDDEGELSKVLSQCWNDSDMVITTGGLGPTPDDKTKQILSHFFSAPLEHHPEAEKLTKKHYSRRNRPLPEKNTYSRLPHGFSPLFNPCGLAPGLLLDKDNKILASLPGVPREMKMMAKQELFPRLKIAYPPNILTIRTHGVTEEDIFLKLCPELWKQLASFGKVASLPRNTGIDLHVTLSNPRSEEIKKLLNESPLKSHIWQFGTLSLPSLVLKKIEEKTLTLALAESATGGLMSSLLTDIPGSSKSLIGSVIAYSNAVKKNILSVPEKYLRTHGGPVNADTARAMATGVQKIFDSDLAISITGIAGPPTPDDNGPVGTVVIGTAIGNDSAEAFPYRFSGTREQLKERFALTGLFRLLSAVEAL